LVVAGPGIKPLYLVDPSTGAISVGAGQEGETPINDRLGREDFGKSVQLVGPTWSPSGRFLAALANLRESDYSYVPVVFTVEGQPVALGQPSGEFPEPFGWSPREDLLAYTQGEAPYRITEAHILDPETGEDRQLVSSDGKKYPIITDMLWSPSGRWIALSLWDVEGDREGVTLRIIDADNGEVRETGIDVGGVTEPLVDWGP
jgi:Tol biopolymer transport system component